MPLTIQHCLSVLELPKQTLRSNERGLGSALRVLSGRTGGRATTRQRQGSLAAQAISIDRRAHLELAWQRQREHEGLLSKSLSAYPAGVVIPVLDLPHLERLLEGASSEVVVVGFYSRSCGVCKHVFRQYGELAAQAAQQRAGVRFLSHDTNDEFDHRSAVARMYGVRTTPSFLFFVGGAVVKGISLPDSRTMLGMGPRRAAMDAIVVHRLREVQATIQELLLKNAPSARK